MSLFSFFSGGPDRSKIINNCLRKIFDSAKIPNPSAEYKLRGLVGISVSQTLIMNIMSFALKGDLTSQINKLHEQFMLEADKLDIRILIAANTPQEQRMIEGKIPADIDKNTRMNGGQVYAWLYNYNAEISFKNMSQFKNDQIFFIASVECAKIIFGEKKGQEQTILIIPHIIEAFSELAKIKN